MTKDTKSIVRGERPRRSPVGKKNLLTVSNQDPEKEYRFVNDKAGRVELFQQAGWEVEQADTHRIGDRRADTSGPAGTAARVPVGQGDYSVLMSIPKDWFAEDQKEKQIAIDRQEQQMKESILSGHKGNFKMGVSHKPE